MRDLYWIINLVVINIGMVFEAVSLDEIMRDWEKMEQKGGLKAEP